MKIILHIWELAYRTWLSEIPDRIICENREVIWLAEHARQYFWLHNAKEITHTLRIDIITVRQRENCWGQMKLCRYPIICAICTSLCEKKNVTRIKSDVDGEQTHGPLNDEKIVWRRESSEFHVYWRISKILEERTKRLMTSKRKRCLR